MRCSILSRRVEVQPTFEMFSDGHSAKVKYANTLFTKAFLLKAANS